MTDDSGGERPDPPRRAERRTARRLAFWSALGLATWLGAGALVGVPAPGPLRRYAVADLQRLADRLNGQPAVTSACRRAKVEVHVDQLRSRVVVDRIGPLTNGVELTPSEQAMLVGGPLYHGASCDIA